MKKTLCLLFIVLMSTALLLSQSLVEVAKKEQERRDKLKGRSTRIITNADLKTVKRRLTMTTQALPPVEPEAAELLGRELLGAREAESNYSKRGGLSYATGFQPDTSLVENPELALNAPDGKFAEIALYGVLVLEFTAKNGMGEDVAIYANRKTTSLESELIGEEDEPLWNDLMTYAVLGLDKDGEWKAIGRGSGVSSPEKFELGILPSVDTIMIIFRYYTEPQAGVKQIKGSVGDYYIGIDAVEALH